MAIKLDKFDKRFSEVIREAADYTCEICFIQCRPESMANIKMECSHDRGRRHAMTRYDPRNAICSCHSCHRKTTEDHDMHVEEFTRIKGSETRRITRELSQPGGRLKKWEKEEIYRHYKNELERIKRLRMDGKQGKIEINIPEVLL